MKKRVLFICVHNSARSQIAEAGLNELGGGMFEAESAGIEPNKVKPQVVEVMREVGIDLSLKGTQSVLEVFKSGMLFHYVIALCNAESAERCPVFPGITKRLHWNLPERVKDTASKEEDKAQFRLMREQIKERITEWLATNP